MDRSVIHDATLEARRLLIKEAGELLQEVYGLASSGKFESTEKLPAVKGMPEVKETRKKLEKFIDDEEKAGMKRPEAVDKLVKEVAFTHLNRLVAFKMMENRKLIRGTIDRYQDSNDFRFYLADHDDDYKLYQAGLMPQDALGEGPRDTAYRHFLLYQCAQMAREIKVLFDPENLPSRLFPRPRALKDLVELLNSPALEEAWGEEETLGWIYQYFTEPDLEIFKGRDAPKVPADLLAPRTQLFTHHWVVKFLVQNSLGRLWMQMHPDSGLAETMDYFIPHLDDIPPAQMKLARDISILDPACGTMHFGLVAFDLLANMYLEEFERADSPGWNHTPSIKSREDIPAMILAYNLHGIDIDLRAVQISALSLYLKAKKFSPKTNIIESNLACADVRLLNGTRLEDFLKKMRFTNPVYERVIKKVWSELKDAEQFGSLLRLEKEIGNLVAKEKSARRPEISLSSYMEGPSNANQIEEFWEILDQQLIQAFDEFARQQSQAGIDYGLFAGEAVKGFKLLDILMRRYDIIVTNPPYLDNRDYNSVLKTFLELEYPKSKRNLYSAFVERCLELLSENGRLGIITGQSFMFISSFEAFRKNCLQNSVIECLMQHDYGLFESRVDTTAYILRLETNAARRSMAKGTCFRLVKEPDSEAKRLRFERALTHLRAGEDDSGVFCYRQADFDAIPGSPWVYWITPGLRRLFTELPMLREIAKPKQGLKTADNMRFLRFWWECGKGQIKFNCRSLEECEARHEKWYPYMKGGPFCKWYGNQENCINFGQNGTEIKAWTDTLYGNSGWSRQITSTGFYFRQGVTWTDLTSGRFSARLSPGGFIFDLAGSHVFPENILLILGIMNSRLAQIILSIINPTVHVQIGDLARLPIPTESNSQLENLVDRAISLAMADSTEDETTFDFIDPPWYASSKDTLTEIRLREDALKDAEQAIDEEVYRLYSISAENRQAIESELAELISDDDKDTAEDESKQGYINEVELDLRWISYVVGIVMGRFQPGVEGSLGCGRFSKDAAEKLRSLADTDGVVTLDEGHQDDLARKVWEALQIALGETGALEIISAVLGDGNPEALLRRYLEKDFFKRHLQQYRKRPVYWLLQSPAKSYSIYVFHEKATKDTLPLILGSRYVGGKINRVRSRIDEITASIKSSEGRARKKLEKELEDLEAQALDVEAFEAAIRRVLAEKNQRQETVGWSLEIDDGVILNLAPLLELMPSWKEPEKYWKLLQKGEYDWSYTAMRYWPDRVLDKCKTNKSYAIAHGRQDIYEGGM